MQIREAKTDILKALNYRLTLPSPYTFLVRFLKAVRKDKSCDIRALTTVSEYILENTLLSFHMNKEYLPSELAAMAVLLAQTCMELGSSSLSGPQWSETLCITTKYSRKKVEQIAVDFIKEEDTVQDYGLKKTLKRKYKGAVTYQRLLRLALCSLK